MIYPCTNETQTRWNHGEYRVQLLPEGHARPIGFCDGSSDDLAELRGVAESEGADEMKITKKRLKSGREIWILGSGQ